MVRRTALLAATLGLLSSSAWAQPDAGNEFASGKLISEFAALTPGETNYLGLTFDIEPKWHLYWNGANDTGFPIHLDLKLPDGYTLGEIQWPAPQRYLAPGDLLDHIYERRVTLLLPISVPTDASGSATFNGSTEFLVCQEACLPGGSEVSLTLPVGGEGVKVRTAAAARFDEARHRIPQPLPSSMVTFHTRGDRSAIEIKVQHAQSMHFYPAEDSVKLVNAIKDATVKGNTLALRLDEPEPAARLRGVLEVNLPHARPLIYAVDVPITLATDQQTANPADKPR